MAAEIVMPDGTVVDALGNFVGIDQPAAAKTHVAGDGNARCWCGLRHYLMVGRKREA